MLEPPNISSAVAPSIFTFVVVPPAFCPPPYTSLTVAWLTATFVVVEAAE